LIERNDQNFVAGASGGKPSGFRDSSARQCPNLIWINVQLRLPGS